MGLLNTSGHVLPPKVALSHCHSIEQSQNMYAYPIVLFVFALPDNGTAFRLQVLSVREPFGGDEFTELP